MNRGAGKNSKVTLYIYERNGLEVNIYKSMILLWSVVRNLKAIRDNLI